jgi:uroporphyrinogen decarboxylase
MAMLNINPFKRNHSIPVWFMRQAGRYLPEYQTIRAQAGGFMALCQSPQLAAQVSLQPIQRFDLDAVIVFSDILVVLDALGFKVTFEEGVGPMLKSLVSLHDVINTQDHTIAPCLTYTPETITRLMSHTSLPIIGFVGSPWTLLLYALEGGVSKKNFQKARQIAYDDPVLTQAALAVLAHHVACYACMQLAAGARVLMVFDTWGHLLNHHNFSWTLNALRMMLHSIRLAYPDIPIIMYARVSLDRWDQYAALPVNVLSMDETINIMDAYHRYPQHIIQGNMDPLRMTLQHAITHHDISHMPNNSDRYVFNLGHGMLPNSHLSTVQSLLHTLKRDTG